MSTDVLLAQLLQAEQAKVKLEEKLPFFSRMKYRYWGPKAKLVLWGWVIKTLAVVGLVWGKVAVAWVAIHHPVAAAVMQKAAEKAMVFVVGAIAVATNSTS